MNENPTNAQEQYELGEKYEKGDGVFKDLQDALKWYTKAADQDHAEALFRLSRICSSSYASSEWGVEHDKVKARRLLQKAIERGSARAMGHYAWVLSNGDDDGFRYKIDKETSAHWYVKSAELGDMGSQCETGYNYYIGSGVPKDFEKAFYWYTKAAEQGAPCGQHGLGLLYAEGNGVPKDLEKARYWLSLAAAEKNHLYFNYKDYKKSLDRFNAGKSPVSSGGCYIATCVYGSYDCPEVWTLRRYRDNSLSASWFGRQFIQIYYAVSPKLVELFGDRKWFSDFWKPVLNKLVCRLQKNGIDDSPYRMRDY